MRKSTAANLCDTIGNSHRCKAAAISESIITNGYDTVWDGHGCQTATLRESIMTNGCDTVCFPLVVNCFWYHNFFTKKSTMGKNFYSIIRRRGDFVS